MILRVSRASTRVCAAGLGGLLAVTIAACGDNSTGAGDGETVTLTVGVIPIADVAPLFLGIEEGFFEEEGLEIEPQYADGGAAIVPAVVGGDYEIGFSNIVSLITATEQGLPVTIVAPAVDEATTEADAFAGLIVAQDGPIQDLSDLAGGTVAVNSLRNINELAVNASFRARGLPLEDITYTEVPIPDMPAAVEAGRVDAAMVAEPFTTIAADTTRVAAASYYDIAPGLSVAQYFADEQYVADNPDVIERFQRAIHRSLDFAQDNPERARGVVLDYTQIPPDVVAAMNLPSWSSTLNVDSVEHVAELMLTDGFVDQAPDLDRLLAGMG